jgi:SprT-like family
VRKKKYIAERNGQEWNDWLVVLYRQYNRRWFGGKLPERIYCYFCTGNVFEDKDDYCCGEHEVNEIHDGFSKFKKAFDNTIRVNWEIRHFSCLVKSTMLHEMAHLKVWMRMRKFGHGKEWQREMRRLARIGAMDKIW